MTHVLPFGPVSYENAWVDNYSYEDVKESHCVASVANNICKNLLESAHLEGKKFLAVCCPAYNEESEEMMKTMVSMMNCFHYMRTKTAKSIQFADAALQEEFNSVIPILVPIFDGTKALSASMKEFISENFPHALDELEGKSEPGTTDVRIHCNKFWYYAGQQKNLNKEVSNRIRTTSQIMDNQKNERLSLVLSRIMDGLSASQLEAMMQGEQQGEIEEKEDNNNDLESQGGESKVSRTSTDHRNSLKSFVDARNSFAQDVMYFYMCPIIKKSNHRKHNSHQWFFDAICDGLEDKVVYAFLTDAGTSYQPQCLSYMLRELYQMHDLIGVTARQRVDTPNRFFKPCQDSPFSCLVGDHSNNVNPCWKCWATWLLSPAPLQGFEFEAASILSLAMFNMVEVLPVMPGPCQMLNWQKMKKFNVVDEYFNLLFEGENQKKLPQLPHGLRTMNMNTKDLIADVYETTPRIRYSRQSEEIVAAQGNISFTEFLRVNMRLAEDRILSFVSVFSTGYGTKWVSGATFFYQPEIQWNTLLTQRRRWINGTFAGYLFYFMSERARSRVRGGLLDVHKPGRSASLIDGFFGLQVAQMVMVLICPAVFGLSGYLGIIEVAQLFPSYLSWVTTPIYGPIRPSELWIGAFFFILTVWIYMSFTAPRGKMPEWLCQLLCIYSFAFLVPVYLSIWWTIITDGPGIVGSMVITNLALPFIISFAESVECAIMYILLLPWFVFTALFFLVFIPQYSFARLWDTTWGNRATGKDSAINDRVEDFMKRQNVFFSIAVLVGNIILLWSMAQIFAVGLTAIVSVLFVIFSPIFVQMLFSFVYMFLVLPIRRTFQLSKMSMTKKPSSAAGSNNNSSDGKRADDLGIDYDEEGVNDVTSGAFFLDAVFPGRAKDGANNNGNFSLPASFDQRSFWATPGSPSGLSGSQIELRPLIEEELKSARSPRANHNNNGSSAASASSPSLHKFFQVEAKGIAGDEHSHSSSNSSNSSATGSHQPLVREGRDLSNRIEIAGRYAKV